MVKERSYDLAILRTYGASNLQLIKMIAYEACMILILAFLLGIVFVRIGFYVVKSNFQQSLILELPMQEHLQIGGVVFLMITLSVCWAIYPIIKMNISTILSNEK